MATEDRLTTLYRLADEMTTAGDDVKEKHVKDYEKIIDYVNTSENPKERILAAQQTARFFKYFPDHQTKVLDTLFDLVETDNVEIRKHVTMALISICRVSKQAVSKAADILIQLYETNQPSERHLITQSLGTLLDLNIEDFLKSFFTNFQDGNELVRERSLKFLTTSINAMSDSQLTREVEEQLLNYTKKAMQDVNKDEFISFIKIVSRLKISRTSTGQATLVTTIKTQAELDKDFNPTDADALDKFLLCAKQTQPFLSVYNRASEYINYICLKVLPHLKSLSSNGRDLLVLQALAEMSPHIILEDSPSLINLDDCHKNIYAKLIEYLPMPDTASEPAPVVGEAETAAAAAAESTNKEEGTSNGNGTDDATKPQEDNFQFTHIEFLMYAFMQLSRLKPDLFTEQMQIDSRKQLQHLSNGCKKYSNALESQSEGALRNLALRTTRNISAMIIGVFRRPADFKVATAIVLSCKPIVATPARSALVVEKKNQQDHQKGSSNNNNNNNQSNKNQNAKRPHHDHGYNNKKRFRNFARR